jgi:pentatricopeptide repeat protein
MAEMMEHGSSYTIASPEPLLLGGEHDDLTVETFAVLFFFGVALLIRRSRIAHHKSAEIRAKQKLAEACSSSGLSAEGSDVCSSSGLTPGGENSLVFNIAVAVLEFIVDVCAAVCNVKVLQELLKVLEKIFSLSPTPRMYEAMAGAHAHAGAVDKMQASLERSYACTQHRPSARCYSAVVRGLLSCKLVDAALGCAKEMQTFGHAIPPDLVTAIYRCFVHVGRASDVATVMLPEIPPSPDAAKLLINHCQDSNDVILARKFWAIFQQEGTGLCPLVQKTMLKILVSCGDAGAFVLFSKLQRWSAHTLDSAFLTSLLQRCGCSKSVRFAEQVVKHARETSGMSASTYGALMKVYAEAHRFEKACSIYDQMLAEGLKADDSLCVSVRWYATMCGRVELSQALTEQVERSRAHKACVMQCFFAAIFSASCLCLLGALGVVSTFGSSDCWQDGGGEESSGSSMCSANGGIQDLRALMRILFGPVILCMVTCGRPDALDIDPRQNTLICSGLLL